MRLLNCATFELEEFLDGLPRYDALSQRWLGPPQYAILSHRWLETGDEPTYQSFRDRTAHEKKGLEKIRFASLQALSEGIMYLWVDTICIDKTNHVELSAAINSMYAYYERATVCYAYLNDVHKQSDIAGSVWFTRGWTLQELLAPMKVEFYSKDWEFLGLKSDPKLFSSLEKATGISKSLVFKSFNGPSYTIAERMSWASRRTTAREEDMAYCLLGIFGVSMPLLYGEGLNAFIRLQEQIMQNSTDHSLFAWTDDATIRGAACGLLAWSPRLFASFASPGEDSPDWIDYLIEMNAMREFSWLPSKSGWDEEKPTPWSLTNLGIKIELPLIPFESIPNAFYALLGYGKVDRRPAIVVIRLGNNRFQRIYCDTQLPAEAYGPALDRHGYKMEQFYIPKFSLPLARLFLMLTGLCVNHSQMISLGFGFRESSDLKNHQRAPTPFRSASSLQILYDHPLLPYGVLLDLDLERNDKRIALTSPYSISPPRSGLSSNDVALGGDGTATLAVRSDGMSKGEMLVITACIIEEMPWDGKTRHTVWVQASYCRFARSLPHQVLMDMAYQLRPSLKLFASLVLFREGICKHVFRKCSKFEKSGFKVALLLIWIKAIRDVDMTGFGIAWEQVRSWVMSALGRTEEVKFHDLAGLDPYIDFLPYLQEDQEPPD